ncbi:MAG: enoyl-[acyl-carrier-protein] reductase [Oligoflexia bacterium]|nr:enoyl-[acyl-carrier-protein] reductase [Oligoflexia bacterium]
MLGIDLRGKLALVAGVADDQGFGWAIAKALKKAGAKVIITTWPPALNILTMSLERGKLDTDMGPGEEKLSFEKIYPLDAMYDQMQDVPEDVKNNKRYQNLGDFTIRGLRDSIEKDFGLNKLNIVVHSLANGPEVQNALIETSRAGYLAANSASAYSFVSLVKHIGPIMHKGGSFLALSYLAAEKVIPGYGGGMSSAKAALESDVKVLSFEAGRRFQHRVNVISAGPLASRAAKAIGMIENMIVYCEKNAPLQDHLTAEDVGQTAAFLSSDMAKGITGSVIYVDKGMHAMGMAVPEDYTS